MKRRISKPRPGKWDALVVTTATDYLHQNTAVITSRTRVLHVEVEEADRAIHQLTAALGQAKDRRARALATIDGLSLAVSKRRLG